MQFMKMDDGNTHILVEEGEAEQDVLRAIVKASFVLSQAVGMGWMQFGAEDEMSDADADEFISLPPDYGDGVVRMDYVLGRQCKTFVKKLNDGRFALNDRLFERDRGLAEPMLVRAREILAGAQDAEAPSTSNAYQGKSLDVRLAEFGFTRRNREDDWSFRKRVFPDMYRRAPEQAMTFLMGANAAEWSEMDGMLCLIFVAQRAQDTEACAKFAEGLRTIRPRCASVAGLSPSDNLCITDSLRRTYSTGSDAPTAPVPTLSEFGPGAFLFGVGLTYCIYEVQIR